MSRSRRALASRGSRDRKLVPDPADTDRTYTDEETAWLRAVRDYQDRTGRKFPTNCELLALLKTLGYRRVAS